MRSAREKHKSLVIVVCLLVCLTFGGANGGAGSNPAGGTLLEGPESLGYVHFGFAPRAFVVDLTLNLPSRCRSTRRQRTAGRGTGWT